jgi:hypothetical protein
MEIINDLEFSNRFIALHNFSIPGDKSCESQKDILDDDLLLLLLLPYSVTVTVTVLTIFMTSDDLRTTFVRTVECF